MMKWAAGATGMGCRDMSIPSARQRWKRFGNRARRNSALKWVMSSSTWSVPVSRSSCQMARLTTSRGASSAMGWWRGMKRSRAPLRSNPPSPRSASLSRNSGTPGTRRLVGWNWTNSMSSRRAPAR